MTWNLRLDGTQSLESGQVLITRTMDFYFEVEIKNWAAAGTQNGCICAQNIGTSANQKLFQLYLSGGALKLIHTQIDNTLISNFVISDGVYKFAFTNTATGTNTNQWAVYRDGALVGSGTFSMGTGNDTTATFVVGARHGASNSEYGFQATADFGAATLYDIDLDAPIATWSMDASNHGAVPVVVEDTSGNNYDLTGVGFPSTGEDWIDLGGGGVTPVAFSSTVPDQNATNGSAFSLDVASYFSGTETPFTYSLQAGTLPTGLSLSGSVISGTPTVDEVQSGVVIRATDTATNTADTNSFSITVSSTPNTAPVADAGVDQSVTEGDTVTLNGTGSTDADGDPISYQWTQTAGTTVTLSSTTAAQPTFTAPTPATDPETLTFQLVVNDGTDPSTPDTVDIVVAALPVTTFDLTSLYPLSVWNVSTGSITPVTSTAMDYVVVTDTSGNVVTATGDTTDVNGYLTVTVNAAGTYHVYGAYSGDLFAFSGVAS